MARACYRVLGILGLVLLCAPARAQAPDAPDGNKQLAAEWADKAQDRFEAGDYQGAVDAIREAQKHARPPTFTRLLGQAQEKLGHLVEAAAVYQSIVDLTLPPNSKAAWVQAREGARQDLAALSPRIPKLQIRVSGVEPSALTVTLDGAPFDVGKLGVAVPANPGKHAIVVSAAGRRTATREAVLEAGRALPVIVTIEMPPVESPTVRPTVSATAPTVLAPSANPVASSSESSSPASSGQGSSLVSTGRYLSFGLAGAGLIAGAITGGIVLSQVGPIGKACNFDVKVCDQASKPGIEGVQTLSYVSTASFAVAGAGAVLGVLLLVVPRKKPAQVGVAVGPTGMFVEGSF